MATHKQLTAWFEKHEDEHSKFDRIPEKDQLHPLRDICAMLYMHRKMGGVNYKGIGAAEHDEVFFAWDTIGDLTEDDVIYLIRCGVEYDGDGFRMWV